MEAAQETFFYTPECGRTWKFLDNVHNSTQDGDWSAENRGIAEVFELRGVWSHANVDANFKNLLNQLDIDATNQDSIISDLKLAIGGKELSIPSLFEASHDTLEMEEESNDEWPEIIYKTYYSGVPVEQIPRRYNKRLCEVQTTISLFKKNLRKIHQNNYSSSLFLSSLSPSSMFISFDLLDFDWRFNLLWFNKLSSLFCTSSNTEKSALNAVLFL